MSREDDLAHGADNYRRMAAEMAAARDKLAADVRAAYAEGMRKADILRAISHTWSREWLDRVLADQSADSDQDGGSSHSAP